MEFYNCLTAVEKMGFLVSFQAEVNSNTFTGARRHRCAPRIRGCIRESLSEEQYDMLLETTIHEAFRTTESLSNCITPEGYSEVFVAITASQGGGLSDESLSCVADFARAHPHYVALINPDSYDLSAMTPSDFVEIADDGLRL